MQVNRGLALALVTAMALLPTSARGAAAAVNVPPFASPPELAIFGPEVARAVSTTLSQSGVEITADGAPVAGRIEALGDERVRLVAGVAGRSAQVEGPLEEIDRLAVELSARLLQLVPPGSRRSGAGTARTATASAPAVTPRPASPAPTTASAPPSVPAAPPIAPPPPTLEERHGRHPAASVTLAPAKPGPAAAKPAASPAKPAPAVAQPAPAAVTPTKPAPAPVPTTPASPAPAAVAAHGASAAPEPAPAHPTSPAPASPPPPPPPATVAIASPPPDPGTPRTVRPAPPPPPVPSSATADPTYDTLPPPPPPPPVAQRPAPPSRSPSAYRALGRTLLRTVNTPDGCAAGLWATNAARDVLDHIHIQNQLGGCGFVSPPAAASAEAARAGASTVVMAQIERLRFDSVGGGRVLPVGQVRVAVVRDGRVVFLQLLQELSTHTIGTPDQRIAAYDLIATAFTRLAGPLQAVLTDPR